MPSCGTLGFFILLASLTRRQTVARETWYFFATLVSDFQFIKHVQEMPDVPCDAVKRSNEHDIEAVTPGICQQLVETRTLRFAPRNYVAVLMHSFISALFGHFAEVEQLCFQMLVASTHACVNSGSFLHFNSFFLESK
jgi:hypothetical protein